MPVKIAETGLQTIIPSLEDEELVRLLSGQPIRDAQLERHIEPGHAKRSRQGYPAEVMNGGPAAFDEPVDTVQTIASSTRNFEHAMRLVSQDGESADQGREDGRILDVEGDIEEYILCYRMDLSGQGRKRSAIQL
ncbi:MAG TPA: hypothetical protein VF789_21915 [Thermoanaerobaculia bacterium]